MKRFFGLVLLGLTVLSSGMAYAEVQYKAGGTERIRHEFWKNIFDFENKSLDNRNFFRLRTSLWGQADIDEKYSFYVRMTNESKAYSYYPQGNGKKAPHGEINEVIFDNLYFDYKDVLDWPVDIRIGRQDFVNMYGEGFLIQDGTPLDGSRTYYFNAFKASWSLNEKNAVDFIYLNSPRTEEWFPVINEVSPQQALNITDEQGYILYWKNSGIEKLKLEPYFIYKHEDNEGGARLQSQKSDIYTPGIFAKYDLSPFVLRAQVAYQAGKYGANDRGAFGGYAFVDREFKDTKWAPKLSAGYLYLSGDDPATSKNEGWDSLWGRWPMWSELYSLSYNGESGLCYWTNLKMPRLMLEVNPTQKFKAQVYYNFLMADEIPSGTSFAVADGKNRGQLPQCKFTYNFNKNVSTYFLAEYFIPGNFHADTADPALFLRTEVMIKF